MEKRSTGSFTRRLPGAAQGVANPSGSTTKPGPNGTVLVSTGISDVDKIIGGGVPMGGLLMVMEDLETPHHLSLLRYFIAQGIVHGQSILYGSSLASPKAFLGTLPALLTTSDRAGSAEKNSEVLYSAIDQKLFGEKHIAAKDTTQIIAELKYSYTNQKDVEGTHWQTTFNHLVNYGAGYYSYLYAKSIAANIWHKVCVENPLCLSTGNVLHKGFLQHGGARDPTSMIRECLGDQFLISDQLGGVRPCINQLLTELKVHKSSTLFDTMWDNHDFSTELSPKISENDEKVGE